MPNDSGFPIFPYHYLSSRAMATVTMATTEPTLQSPAQFGAILFHFTRQMMKPKVILPMFLIIVLLFDLDNAFDLDDAFDMDEEGLFPEDNN